MTALVTAAERAALPVARAALASRDSAYGIAEAIVFALGAAGHLAVPPGIPSDDITNAVEVLRGLNPQECAAKQHRGWFADAGDGTLPCPWCRIAQLEDAAAGAAYRAARGGVPLGTYSTVAAAQQHCEDDLRQQRPNADVEWSVCEDDQAVIELDTVERGHTSATAYTITTVRIESAYDPEADS